MHAIRLFLALLLVAGVAGCGGETEGGADVTGTPWHMWGNSQTLTLNNATPLTGPLLTQNTQLLQVMYARPESWTFVCEATLLDASLGPPAGNLQAAFEIQIGMGRNTIVLPNFCVFRWDPSTDVGVQRYCTTAVGPLRFAGDTSPNLIESFAAQNIQSRVNVTWSSGGVSVAHLEVSMQVAPRTHIRPEWFQDSDPHNVKKYRGGEQQGL